MERINRDAYEVSGTDLEGFKEAVKKMSAITHCRRINARILRLYIILARNITASM